MLHSLSFSIPTNIDPLLTCLQNSGLGLSIDIIDYVTVYYSVYYLWLISLYAGGFIHADDITALSSSTESLEKHISIFSKGNL